MDSKPKRVSALTLTGLLEVTAGLLCLASVTGFLGRLWWLFELPSHFRLQLAFALGLLAVVWSVRRRWPMAVVCGALALVNASLVLSLFWPAGKNLPQSGPRLRLVSLNVNTANQRTDLVLDFLRKTDADVILLMEVDDRWMNGLSPLNALYAHRVSAPREDNFGIVLFSRLPLTNSSIVELGGADVPSIATDIDWAGQVFFLLGTHPLPPGSSEYARQRNGQFKNIAALVCQQSRPAIVLGDLNVTPWSPYFSNLLKTGGLINTSQGLGLYNSWPSWFSWAGIPIDHCLVTPSWSVRSKRLGPQVGSDHLPVIIDLQLPAAGN